jgi:geranylgeranyl diphosphate synthase, type I
MTCARSRVPPPTPETPLSKVEALMQRYARGGRIDRVGAMALEQLATGGRRFRARLALLACAALDVPERDAVHWAAAVELLHNATLIHDDIQDQDTTRRGAPTLWVKHGYAQAINAGDFMLMLPHLVVEESMSRVRDELSFALARAATNVVRGQANEMSLRQAGRFDWESYLAAARGKTGALLGLPIYGALRLAGRSAERAQRTADLYLEVGALFQLQDDLVDLFGDKGRGQVGCDVYEGKVSALVVAQLERSPQSRPLVLGILDLPRPEKTAKDVQLLKNLFERSGAKDAVIARIASLRSEILNAECLREEPTLWPVTDELVRLTLAPVEHLLSPSQPVAPEAAQALSEATA